MGMTLFLTLAFVSSNERFIAELQKAHDTKAIQGKWKVVVFDTEGYWLTATGPIGAYCRSLEATFTDKRMTIKAGKDAPPWPARLEYIWDHNYAIDPTKQPKEIDVKALGFFADGSARETGKVWRGIYDLQKDRLTICLHYSTTRSIRPNEFSTAQSGERIIWLFERERRVKK